MASHALASETRSDGNGWKLMLPQQIESASHLSQNCAADALRILRVVIPADAIKNHDPGCTPIRKLVPPIRISLICVTPFTSRP